MRGDYSAFESLARAGGGVLVHYVLSGSSFFLIIVKHAEQPALSQLALEIKAKKW